MRKLKPIEEIQKLSRTQLAQLHTWFEQGVTLHGAMARFLSDFGFGIKYHKIHRYYHLWKEATELRQHSQEKLDLLEILQVLQGEAVPFSQVTLHLIQKAACTMALNPDNTTTDLVRLMRVANNPVNQQLAQDRVQIQQEKLTLEKRKQTFAEKHDPVPEKPKKLTTEQQTERMWEIFHVPEEERVRRRAINAARAAAAAAAAANNPAQTTEGAHPTPNAEVAQASLPAGPEASSLDSQTTSTTDTAHPNSLENQITNPSESASSDSQSAPQFAAAKVSLGDQIRGGLGEPIQNPKPAIIECSLCASGIDHLSTEPLTKRSNDYTVRRAKEYWSYRREESAWYALQAKRPYNAGKKPEYVSQLRECPCGAALPCAHHEEFFDRFWTVSPYDGFYMVSLLDRGIPYREPREFLA